MQINRQDLSFFTIDERMKYYKNLDIIKNVLDNNF